MERLWDILYEYDRMGFLMGAGTHQHTEGDKATNEMGIVYSHAYALL